LTLGRAALLARPTPQPSGGVVALASMGCTRTRRDSGGPGPTPNDGLQGRS